MDRVLRYIFRRFYLPRLAEMVSPRFPILLDYPIDCSPRYGFGRPPHPQLFSLLDAGRCSYATRLQDVCSLREELSKIPNEESGVEPSWGPQRYFSSLDAAALYGLLVEFQPGRFFETGSGYSTRFARRAIRQHGLPTKITSIDPHPRAEVDTQCDSVIREPLESVDLEVFDELEAGDFLFVDGSHRCFQNSDVTTVFMDILPRVKPGVIVHLHDIFLPYDYPPEWRERYYSEQYLLGTYLIAATPEVLLPNAFVIRDPELASICKPLMEIPGISRPLNPLSSPYGIGGSSFWMRV